MQKGKKVVDQSFEKETKTGLESLYTMPGWLSGSL